jgi:hypothetical protein
MENQSFIIIGNHEKTDKLVKEIMKQIVKNREAFEINSKRLKEIKRILRISLIQYKTIKVTKEF